MVKVLVRRTSFLRLGYIALKRRQRYLERVQVEIERGNKGRKMHPKVALLHGDMIAKWHLIERKIMYLQIQYGFEKGDTSEEKQK